MTPPRKPDYWIRKPGRGEGWWFTFTAPVAPHETESLVAYRCDACDQTFRLVESIAEGTL